MVFEVGWRGFDGGAAVEVAGQQQKAATTAAATTAVAQRLWRGEQGHVDPTTYIFHGPCLPACLLACLSVRDVKRTLKKRRSNGIRYGSRNVCVYYYYYDERKARMKMKKDIDAEEACESTRGGTEWRISTCVCVARGTTEKAIQGTNN